MNQSRSGGSSQPKSNRQTTLFQTWGYEGNIQTPPPAPAPKSGTPTSAKRRRKTAAPKATPGPADPMASFLADDGGEDDADLAAALEESLAQVAFDASAGVATPAATPSEVLPGFDVEAGRTWVYPVNYPERSYQFDIVKACLYRNTLVTLPTGLGKTFIAAVVMYNFFRWYPTGKVVFMAPTKPLVAQQIEACFKIMGIPQVETMEMTGNVAVATREKAWKQKRVLFMTPQVMSNDLSRGLFPARQVKLLVVDEAHRAQGEYAYCQVVKELLKNDGHQFRVVALSATPGSDLNAVRAMLGNLAISHIELRSEDSPDILPYTFQRTIQKTVVPLGEELARIKGKFLVVMEVFVKRLAKKGALFKRGNSANPTHYSKFGLLTARNEFRQNPPAGMDRSAMGLVEGDFASGISLYHAYELLLQQGLRCFQKFVSGAIGDESGGGNRRLRYELLRIPAWQEIDADLREKFADDASHPSLNESRPQLLTQAVGGEGGSRERRPIVLSHPKMERLRDMVVEHFQDKEKEGVATRVMIFTNYRDSVKEITACLEHFKPLIKVMQFVGQAGAKGKKGLSQKEQIAVVRKFRDGGYNTLVATCVGEEGLDIGEVDLIVCYDVSKSPIRLVQRMGRTGRKRAGKIIVLVTEGKEEQTYNQSMYTKNSINKAITDKSKLASFLTDSPRMIPRGIQPVCHRMSMVVNTFVDAKASKQVAPANNRRISGMFAGPSSSSGRGSGGGKAGSNFRHSSGFLNPAELDYWQKNYYVPEEAVLTLKPRRELWRTAEEMRMTASEFDASFLGRAYDLSEWNLWQDQDQRRTVKVTKSASSRMLTSTLLMFQRDTDFDADEVKMRELLEDEHVGSKKVTIQDHFRVPAGKAKRIHIAPKPSDVVKNEVEDECDVIDLILDDEENECDLALEGAGVAPDIVVAPEGHAFDSSSPDFEDQLPAYLMIDESGVHSPIKPAPSMSALEETLAGLDESLIAEYFASEFAKNRKTLTTSLRLCWKERSGPGKGEGQSVKKVSDNFADRKAKLENTLSPSSSPPIPRPIDTDSQSSKLWKNEVDLRGRMDNIDEDDGEGDLSPVFKSQIVRKKEERRGRRDETMYHQSSPAVAASRRPQFLQQQTSTPNCLDNGGLPRSAGGSATKSSKKTLFPDEGRIRAHLNLGEDVVGLPSPVLENGAAVNGRASRMSRYEASDVGGPIQGRGDEMDDSMNALFEDSSLDLIEATTRKSTAVKAKAAPDRTKPFVSDVDLIFDDSSFGARPRENSSNLNLAALKDSRVKSEGKSLYGPSQLTEMMSPIQNKLGRPQTPKVDEMLGGMKSGSGLHSSAATEETSRSRDGRSQKAEEEESVGKAAGEEFDSLEKLFEEDDDLFASFANEDILMKPESDFKLPDLSRFEEATSHQQKVTPKRNDASTRGSSSSPLPKLALSPSSFSSKLSPLSAEKSQFTLKASGAKFSPALANESQGDSPFVPRQRSKKRKLAFEASSSEDESEATGNLADGKRTTMLKEKRAKKSKKPAANQFIEYEAALSEDEDGDGNHQDDSGNLAGEDEDMDALEASFVNDATQGVSDRQRAIYLESVRSPIGAQPFVPPSKLISRRPLRPITADIFSQMPDESELNEGYGDDEDSFVVKDDEVEESPAARDLDTMDLLADNTHTPSNMVSGPRKRNVGRTKIRERFEQFYGNKNAAKEPEVVTENDREGRGKKCRIKGAGWLSSSEDETSVGTTPPARERLPEVEREKRPEQQEKFKGEPTSEDHFPSPTKSVDFQLLEPDLNESLGRASKPTVIVNSSEVHKIAELISCLKHEHSFHVHVRSFEGAGFLVSTRLAIDRRLAGDFANGSNRQKVIARCQQMNDLFERPCLILESQKKDEDGNVVQSSVSKVHRTKYLDSLMGQLAQSRIQFFFSENQQETASIVSALLKKEANKGFDLPKGLERLSPVEERIMLPFYQTLPGVGLGIALTLLSKFTSLEEFANSAHATIQRKGKLSEAKARKICDFLRREFHGDL